MDQSKRFARRHLFPWTTGFVLLLALMSDAGGSGTRSIRVAQKRAQRELVTAQAGQTFTVNTTSDANHGDCGIGNCSLRDAILAANNLAGADTIVFNIPSSDPGCSGGFCTISPTSALPTITGPVTIDGYSQPGASPNTLVNGDNAVMRIVLRGNDAGNGASGLTISGGSSSVRGLVINGFNQRGILLTTNGNNVIEGNFIGTNVYATIALQNHFDGLTIETPSSNNLIGGTTPAARNVISGNAIAGITIESFGSESGSASGNLVQGNYIGIAADGITPLGNTAGSQAGWGVAILRKASGNTIGGTSAGAGNKIAHNAGPGVGVGGSSGISLAVNNAILGNSIYSNGQLGIDLKNSGDPSTYVDGVTANDACDSDIGPNNLQNFPILTSAVFSGGNITIQGSLNSNPNTSFYRIEFFASETADSSGNGQGQLYIGSTQVATDGSCNGVINVTFPVPEVPGHFITATATDPANNTSEFSNSIEAIVEAPTPTPSPTPTATPTATPTPTPTPTATPTPTPLPCLTVTTTADAGAGSLRAAIDCANANPGLDTITFNIPSSDPGCHNVAGVGTVCTISVISGLPDITDSVTIDGYTQPGSSPNTLAVGDDAKILIELEGSNPVAGNAFTVRASDVTLRGLVINRFSPGNNFGVGTAIVLDGFGPGPGDRLVVEGCFIGTDVTGTIALPNAGDGIRIGSSDGHRIGGPLPAQRNIISGNTGLDNYFGVGVGINIGPGGNNGRPFTTNVQVLGNYIGVDSSGNVALGNAAGVAIGNGLNHRIGGPNPGERNVIGGGLRTNNNFDACYGSGICIGGGDSNHLVQGNYIGIGADGMTPVGNANHGIDLGFRSNNPGNLIGGPNPGEGNVISSNSGNGILSGFSNSNTYQGNLIGTAADGTTPRGNTLNGIICSSSNGETIGGAAPGAGNIIAFNGRKGVVLNAGSGGTQSVVDPILGNSIHDNNSLGIDLNDDGVTLNDHCDADHSLNGGGANGNQNYPVLTSATAGGGSAHVHGNFNSVSNTTYRIEFFSNASCDPSGYGEGRTFLGATDITTDANCDAVIDATVAGNVPTGEFITATATDPAGNTSEFSNCVAVNPAPVPASVVSRKTHGFVGDFDIPLPVTGTPGIECRSGGPTNDYEIVFTFDNVVTVDGSPQAEIVSGAGTIGSNGVGNGGAVIISEKTVTVPLTNISNKQTITIVLHNVHSGGESGDVTASMSVLIGDTNADQFVDASDIAQTKSQSGHAVDNTNFREDLNADGFHDSSDIGLVKSKSGTAIPVAGTSLGQILSSVRYCWAKRNGTSHLHPRKRSNNG